MKASVQFIKDVFADTRKYEVKEDGAGFVYVYVKGYQRSFVLSDMDTTDYVFGIRYGVESILRSF